MLEKPLLENPELCYSSGAVVLKSPQLPSDARLSGGLLGGNATLEVNCDKLWGGSDS
jgi:hypothetical protein